MAMVDLLYCTAGPSIDLHIDVGRELPPLICSPRDLVNVVLNLVASARDAMPSGGELGISARVDKCSIGENFEEQCVVLQIEAACGGERDAGPEERSVGKGRGRQCRMRWMPYK